MNARSAAARAESTSRIGVPRSTSGRAANVRERSNWGRSVIYLITFVCYGRHLHGCESGSVGHEHNVPGTPILEVDSARAAGNRSLTFAAPNRRISTFIGLKRPS